MKEEKVRSINKLMKIVLKFEEGIKTFKDLIG
jgi:hypothetical protein